MIDLLTSCNTEERIAQNIYIHNSNRNYKRINNSNSINQETVKRTIKAIRSIKSNAQDSSFA